MKKALITASCLLIAGIIICFAAIALIDFDFGRLDTNMYTTNTYEFTENINNIIIDCSTADIEIIPSENSTAKVVCYEQENKPHTVTLSDGTLRVEKESSKWYKNIGFFNFKTPEITLYLPQKEYTSISVECSTGDVNISNIMLSSLSINLTTGDAYLNNLTLTDLNLKATTGDTFLNNVTANNINLKATTGDIELKDTCANNRIDINITTGDIEFKNSDAAEINCKATTGDITGTLLSGKVFSTHTSTGAVDVPSSAEGGLCELKTTTGDIRINIISE